MDKYNSDSPTLPAEIVLSPSWWNKHAGISFDEDFFFHPVRRVEAEQKMEKVLYEKWGQYGLGSKTPNPEPVVGAVHLASGFLVQEMLGCRVDYTENAPPQVIGAGQSELICDPAQAFESAAFKRFAEKTLRVPDRRCQLGRCLKYRAGSARRKPVFGYV